MSEFRGSVANASHGLGTIEALEDRSLLTALILSVDSPGVVEGDSGFTTLTFTASTDAVTTSPLLGLWTIVEGSATFADADLVTTSGFFVIPTGSDSATFNVLVVGDLKVEANENFTATVGFAISLGGTDTVDVSGATGTGAIINDDFATLSIVANSPTVTEGDSGTTSVTYTVTLNKAVTGGFDVAYGADPSSTASGTDYNILGTSLHFDGLAGESHDITVEIVGDEIVEADETLVIKLGEVSGSDLADSVESGATATTTITNDDFATLTIMANNPNVTEGNSGSTPVTYTVQVDKAVQGGFTVAFLTSGTADGTDYSGLTASPLTFIGDAMESHDIMVDILGDMMIEPDETLTITLDEVIPGMGGPLATSITSGASDTTNIINDDFPTGVAVTVNLSNSNNTIVVSKDVDGNLRVKRSGVDVAGYAPVAIDTVSSLTINGGTAVDKVILDASLNGAFTGSLTFNGGAGNVTDSLDASAITSFGVKFDGGEGNNLAKGGAGNDTLIGGSGVDVYYGNGGDDDIHGGAGKDRLYGGEGNDCLIGGADGDLLDGGNGNDSIQGGAGNDTIFGGGGQDVIDGGADNDSILGGAGNDVIRGNSGNDTIKGDAGFDLLYGDAGNDKINGGADNDTLFGGEGNDTLTGDSGTDQANDATGTNSISAETTFAFDPDPLDIDDFFADLFADCLDD